jgi:hypothetical protein
MHAIVATRALPCSNPLAFEPRQLPDPTPGDQDLLIRQVACTTMNLMLLAWSNHDILETKL